MQAEGGCDLADAVAVAVGVADRRIRAGGEEVVERGDVRSALREWELRAGADVLDVSANEGLVA